MLSSIPSPGAGSLVIGPFELRAYGLMIALGVLVAVWVAQRRWAARGGDPDEIGRIALWAVPAGVVGARLYHVITDWKRFDADGWTEAFAIWKGGLGIPGGMAAGILAGLWVIRRRRLNRGEVIAAIVPVLPLAQAIGRAGNWFNQELYGSPTDLPWGLEIDRAHRPVHYMDVETFHPTFLYEALWNVALCLLLVALDRRRLRAGTPTLAAARRETAGPGSILAVYIGGYGLGRLWIEAVRIDEASLIWGVRVNIWMSLALIAASTAWLVWSRRRPRHPGRPVIGA